MVLHLNALALTFNRRAHPSAATGHLPAQASTTAAADTADLPAQAMAAILVYPAPATADNDAPLMAKSLATVHLRAPATRPQVDLRTAATAEDGDRFEQASG